MTCADHSLEGKELPSAIGAGRADAHRMKDIRIEKKDVRRDMIKVRNVDLKKMQNIAV